MANTKKKPTDIAFIEKVGTGLSLSYELMKVLSDNGYLIYEHSPGRVSYTDRERSCYPVFDVFKVVKEEEILNG